MDFENEDETEYTCDLEDMLEACRTNHVSQLELVYVLSNNLDSDTIVDVLVEEFGHKHAMKLMKHALYIAKKQKRKLGDCPA